MNYDELPQTQRTKIDQCVSAYYFGGNKACDTLTHIFTRGLPPPNAQDFLTCLAQRLLRRNDHA